MQQRLHVLALGMRKNDLSSGNHAVSLVDVSMCSGFNIDGLQNDSAYYL